MILFSFFLMVPRTPTSTLFPYTTLFRSDRVPRRGDRGGLYEARPRAARHRIGRRSAARHDDRRARASPRRPDRRPPQPAGDRKSTRLNSSHGYISYAVFCLKKKKQKKKS